MMVIKKFVFIIIFMVFSLVGTISHAVASQTVAVIGTGDMGDSLGPRLAGLGYRVIYGSRKPGSDSTQALVKHTGHGASASTAREAAKQADIVLLAVPWPAMETVAQNLGNLSGKLVIDISMPVEQDEQGYPRRMLATSSAEMIQGWNPGARVVKAFATLGSFVIDEPMVLGGVISVPIAADDSGAKQQVVDMVAAMGLDPVDAGPLRMAREIEGLQMLYMVPLYQRRKNAWEPTLRRARYWECVWESEFSEPVFDQDRLVRIPAPAGERGPCP
jgi:predicted dinucleotide-binding enzyme